MKELDTIGKELSRHVKTQKDLAEVMGHLTKTMLESILNAELDSHLGYEKHEKAKKRRNNTRNGYSEKTLKTEHGELEIRMPRDRSASFEPAIVPKGKTRLDGFEDTILTLYAQGLSVRQIQETIRDLYHGAEISTDVISNVTDAVIEEVRTRQNRPLDAVYPIVYLDCIVVKVRDQGRVINKSVYLALGVSQSGHKEILGQWIAETESSKFWLSALTELNNRGVKDIFLCCIDGLKGFAEAVQVVFPKTQIQLCIVHIVRNSLRYVSTKDRKEVAKDLKEIYNSPTLDAAEQKLEVFAEKWSSKYPRIEKSWRSNWDNLITIFNYPMEIRRIIYTTNAIESLNSVIRKSIRNRKIFPSDQSAAKVIYLAVKKASEHWTMPLRNWIPAMNRFAIEYEGRYDIENEVTQNY